MTRWNGSRPHSYDRLAWKPHRPGPDRPSQRRILSLRRRPGRAFRRRSRRRLRRRRMLHSRRNPDAPRTYRPLAQEDRDRARVVVRGDQVGIPVQVQITYRDVRRIVLDPVVHARPERPIPSPAERWRCSRIGFRSVHEIRSCSVAFEHRGVRADARCEYFGQRSLGRDAAYRATEQRCVRKWKPIREHRHRSAGPRDGTFGPRVDYRVQDYPSYIAVGDLNLDGNPTWSPRTTTRARSRSSWAKGTVRSRRIRITARMEHPSPSQSAT